MRQAHKLLILSALSVQAACSYTPPPITYIPPPDVSTYASLTCEELVYKRDGYQHMLKNVALDHPADTQRYRLGIQSQLEGLTNAIAQRGCGVVAQQPVAAQSTAQNSYCLGKYISQVFGKPEQGGTGFVTAIWEDKAISARPASVALGSFQALMTSKGQSARLLPADCESLPDLQTCTARSEVGDFTMTLHTAQVTCSVSQLSIEKLQQYSRTKNPRLAQIEWRPANARPARQPANQALGTHTAPAPVTPQRVQIAPKTEVVTPTTSTTNEYCYFYFTSDDFRVKPNVISPIFRDTQVSKTAANQITAIKQYQHKVNQSQSDTWRAFDFNLIPCNPAAGVCMGVAHSLFKPKQVATLVCFTSASAAQAKLDYDRRLDPQAITIDR